MKKFFVVVLLAMLLVPATFFAAENEEEVRFSAVFSMTGAASAYGRMCYEGVELGTELYPTVLGKDIKVKVIDTKSDKVEAANGVRRAIENDRAFAILGNIISGNCLAGSAVAEELRTPMMTPSGTNPMITEGKEFMNRVCFLDSFQGTAAARLMTDLGNYYVAVFVDVEQDYSVALSKYFQDEFKKLGGTMFMEYYKTGDQDFSAQVLDAMSKGVDAFYMPGYYQEIALISSQAYDSGFYGDLVSSDGAYAPETLSIGGKAVEGLYLTALSHPDAPLTNENAKEFQEAYMEKYDGKKPSAFAGLGYDAYLVVRDAIERAGTLDKEKVAKEIRKTKDFPGATGIITINENGNAEKSVTVVTVKDGEFAYDSMINP